MYLCATVQLGSSKNCFWRNNWSEWVRWGRNTGTAKHQHTNQCWQRLWESCAVGRQDTHTGLCGSWFTRKTEDKRQQWLWYKLKSLWIRYINMIMRAMRDQSKFNYLPGGLLAPRGFLILLSRWCFHKQMSSQLSPEKKDIDQSILQARKILLSGPLCAQQGCCSLTTFRSSRCSPGASDHCPCVWPSQGISEPTTLPCTGGEAVPYLWHMLSSSSVLTPSLIPAPWAKHTAGRSPTSEGLTAQIQLFLYAAQTPSPHHTQQRSQVTSSSLFTQQWLLVWEPTYLHEGGLHKPVHGRAM